MNNQIAYQFAPPRRSFSLLPLIIVGVIIVGCVIYRNQIFDFLKKNSILKRLISATKEDLDENENGKEQHAPPSAPPSLLSLVPPFMPPVAQPVPLQPSVPSSSVPPPQPYSPTFIPPPVQPSSPTVTPVVPTVPAPPTIAPVVPTPPAIAPVVTTPPTAAPPLPFASIVCLDSGNFHSLIRSQQHIVPGFPREIGSTWYVADPAAEKDKKIVGADPPAHAIIIFTKIPNETRTLFCNDCPGFNDPQLKITPDRLEITQDNNRTAIVEHGLQTNTNITLVWFNDANKNPKLFEVFIRSEGGGWARLFFRKPSGSIEEGSWFGGLRSDHTKGRHRYSCVPCCMWYQSKEEINDATKELIFTLL